MKYAFLVAWREFAENAKTRGFWIGIFVTPAILFLAIQVPIFLEQKATPTRAYVLVDQSGALAPAIETSQENDYQRKVLSALNEYARKHAQAMANAAAAAPDPLREVGEGNAAALEVFRAKGGQSWYLAQLAPRLKPGAPHFQEPRRKFRRVALPEGLDEHAPLSTLADALKPYLRGEKEIAGQALSAAILVPASFDDLVVRPGAPDRRPATTDRQIQYWSASADWSLREAVEQVANTEVRRREYLAKGLDRAAIKQVEQTYASFSALNPKKEKGKEAVETTDIIKQWAPSGFVYLLWLAIFVIIQMLLNNTIEEKSNRIIEVLLSSVTPGELMMGKLFGIAAIGLTMVGSWVLSLFAVLSWQSGSAAGLAGQVLTVLRTSNLLPLFCVYFVLGYLLYAAFILSIGSVCNTIKEAQSYMGVLTMFLMVPMLTMTFIPRDPNGPVARVLSWIPFYTPFTMMNRATADPPLVDQVGTLLLLLATTALALWMAGKIFRIGILRTGQPPRVLEMLKWATRKGN